MCFTQPFLSQQGLMTLTNSIKSGGDLIKPRKQCHGPQGPAPLPCQNAKCERNVITSRLLHNENISLRGIHTDSGSDSSADNCHHLFAPN